MEEWIKIISELMKYPAGAAIVFFLGMRFIDAKYGEKEDSGKFVKKDECRVAMNSGTVSKDECHTSMDTLKDILNKFENKMIEETTENRIRLDGIGERMTNQYIQNDRRYLQMMESNKAVMDKIEQLKK